MNYNSASVLVFKKVNKEVFFLLGRDNKDKYSDFGGYKENKDMTDKDTAIREFNEETMGAFINNTDLNQLLDDNKKFYNKKYKHIVYIINILIDDNKVNTYNNISNYLNNVLNVENNDNIPKDYFEKKNIRWFKLSDIVNDVDSFKNEFVNSFVKILDSKKYI